MKKQCLRLLFLSFNSKVVRFKVTILNKLIKQLRSFNSKVVRFKVFRRSPQSSPFFVSIPKWFDLKDYIIWDKGAENYVSIPKWFDLKRINPLSDSLQVYCFNSKVVRFKDDVGEIISVMQSVFQFQSGSI